MVRISLFISLVLALAMRGCAAPPASPSTSGSAVRATGDSQSSQRLADLANREASSRVRPPAVDVPSPPGLEPGVLDRRATDDASAFLSLDEALAQFRRDGTPQVELPPVDPDRRGQALMHYAKARNCALDGRMMQAIVELQKAHELDPQSPEVLRELARCYVAADGTAQAVEAFGRLLLLEPDNPDALYAVGLAAANQRNFPASIASLGRLLRLETDREFDEATRIVIHSFLATALRELGYDRAFITAAEPTATFPDAIMTPEHAPRLATIYRQRGETWRAIGDAHARLGEYDRALAAYAAAANLPNADPSALHTRIIYVNLRMGRPYNAQFELLRAISQVQTNLTDRDIRLCAYVREHAAPADALAQAVAEMHKANPDDSALLRAAAALLPADEARTLLTNFVTRRPRDLESVTQLLIWLAQTDVKQAADLAAALAAEQPDLANEYADRLALAVPNRRDLMRAVRSLPPSPSRVHLETKLLWRAGGLGEAWHVSAAARKQWPDDRLLLVQQLHLAATLQECALVDRVLESAPPMNDVEGLLAVSQARRALGQVEPALALAQQAAELESENIEAITERARAHLAVAASLANQPDERTAAATAVQKAIDDAEHAIAQSPSSEGAYEVLAMIYMPGGVRADTDSFRNLLQRMRQHEVAEPLLARLAAQEDLAQRRPDRAIERLLNLYESNPLDSASISLAVTAWQQTQKLDAAEHWLNERLAQRPNDGVLLEQWVRVLLLQSRGEAVLDRLNAMIESDPDDFLARRLLETVYRATGQMDSAMQLGEQRLLARPQGVRREIELAALYASAERAGPTFERLEWVRDHADQASVDELAGAIRVLVRVDADESRRNALTLDLVQRTIERFPDAPLQVYGLGLLALARTDADADAIADMANRAATHARGGQGATIAAAAGWREIAQGLVDDGNPAAAAIAMRARINANAPLEDPALGMLTIVALVADGAADAQSHDPANVLRSMELLRMLDERGRLAVIFRLPDEANLAEGIYEASIFYTLIGSREGAQQLLREVLRLQPDFAMAMNNFGYALLESPTQLSAEDHAEMIRLIERAYELDAEDANILDTLGWLRYKQGRLESVADEQGVVATPGARQLIERSIEEAESPSPEVLDHLGDVAWRLGDEQTALRSWKQAANLVADDRYRNWVMENFRTMQMGAWQLLVADPQTMYDREYGPILERARKKIEEAEAGQQPSVAPLFDESQ